MDSDFEDEKPQKKQRKSAAGRKLMRWNPDVDQLVLLCVDTVCTKQKIEIPWDDVAKEIEPYLTGEAVKQHLAKVRFFRIENGRKVPEKLEKGARRKAKLGSNTGPTTPAKSGRAKKVKDEEDGDEDYDTSAKGASLLWHAPQKKTKTPKGANDANSKTPGTGHGGGTRKNANSEGASGDSFGDASKSTGKRGRKKQEIKKELDDGSDYGSPTKKQKLRQKKQGVNYYDHVDSDEDIFDAQQDTGDDDTYEETQESLPNSIVKSFLSSSQGTVMNDYPPPPPFATSAAPGFNRSFPLSAHSGYAHHNSNNSYTLPPIDHGNFSTSGSLKGYGQQLMYANVTHKMSPTMESGDFRGINHFSTSINSCYGGGVDYGANTLGFNSAWNGPRGGQDLREAGSLVLTAAPEENSTGSPVNKLNQKTAIPLQKAAPKLKRRPNADTPKTKTVQDEGFSTVTAAADGNQKTKVKIEDETPNKYSGLLYNNTPGMIPIANETGYGNYGKNLGMSYSNGVFDSADVKPNIYTAQAPSTTAMSSLGAFANTVFDGNDLYMGNMPFINTNTNQAPLNPIIASPNEFFGNGFGTGNAQTGVTPALNKFGFTNSSLNSSQLTPYESHSSSFSSINASQSAEAMPTIEESGGDMNFGTQFWNPDHYEMQLPGDEFANMGGALGDEDIFY